MRFSQPLKINIVNMTCVFNRHVTFVNISKHHATIQVKYMYYMTPFTKEYVYFFFNFICKISYVFLLHTRWFIAAADQSSQQAND